MLIAAETMVAGSLGLFEHDFRLEIENEIKTLSVNYTTVRCKYVCQKCKPHYSHITQCDDLLKTRYQNGQRFVRMHVVNKA